MVPSLLFCDGCGASNRPQATFCSTCGKTLNSSSPLQQYPVSKLTSTGLLVPNHLLKQRYLVIRQVGRGGMGAVYQAGDTLLGNRLVAVKEMSQSSLSQHEILAAADAFKREALMLANLNHPNLPSIYDHFSEAGRWYLVMSFIEGETLEDYVDKAKGQRLPVQEVLDIGLRLCSVLDYLHSRQPPIIFRDLKPTNVMRTPEGHLYLIDFGIARHFKLGQAKDTNALGSSGYAAPEQYGKAQTGPHSDIYSLGALLHRLVSGIDPSEHPFRFSSLQQNGQPATTRLEKLIMQMVEMDDTKRLSNMAFVKQELQGIAVQLTSGQIRPSYSGVSSKVPSLAQPAPMLNTPLTPGNSLQRVVLNQSVPSPSSLPGSSDQGKNLYTYRGHSSIVWAVSWSPDGQYIASASDDGTVQVWNATSGDHIFTHFGHSDKVNAVSWSPDGQRIASGSNDRTAQVWRATHLSSNSTSHVYPDQTNNTANSSGGKNTVIGSDQIMQGQNDVSPPQLLSGLTTLLNRFFMPRGHSTPMHPASTTHNPPQIASGSRFRTTQTGNNSIAGRGLTYSGHSSWISALTWSPDGQWVASASGDYTVQIWFAAPGGKHFIYRGHSAYVQAVAWSPNGQYIASGSDDGTVRVWDTSTGQTVNIYYGHSTKVKAVTWSPDSRRVVSASLDKTVQVWDALTGYLFFTYSGHPSGVNGVVCSPNGKYIASAGSDKTVQVWDAATGRHVSSYRGHSEGVKAVAWSPDGQMLASSSWDHTVRVWWVS